MVHLRDGNIGFQPRQDASSSDAASRQLNIRPSMEARRRRLGLSALQVCFSAFECKNGSVLFSSLAALAQTNQGKKTQKLRTRATSRRNLHTHLLQML